MKLTPLIVTINIVIFFLQFLPGLRALHPFAFQLLFNIVAGVISSIVREQELAKAFYLSAVVLLLIGPAVAIAAVGILAVVCLGAMAMPHHY